VAATQADGGSPAKIAALKDRRTELKKEIAIVSKAIKKELKKDQKRKSIANKCETEDC
jgi:hypothetical protein